MTEITSNNSQNASSYLLLIVRVLFILNTILWLVLGIVSLVRLHPINLGAGVTPLIIPSLMFGNAAAMLLSSIGVSKKRNFFFYFAVAVLLLNIVLIALHDFDLIDLFTILLALLLLALLPMLPPWRNKHSSLTNP